MFRREWDFTTAPVTFRLSVVSSKRQATGEDYPAAAGKHCDDAGALLAASRFDGAAYLAGYAVECMLKTVIQVEQGTVAPVLQHRHNLDNLSGEERHSTWQPCYPPGLADTSRTYRLRCWP